MSSGPLSVEDPKHEPEISADRDRDVIELHDSAGKLGPQLALVVIVLLAAALFWWLLFATKTVPVVKETEVLVPVVRVQAVQPTGYRHRVVAHGSVTPRTESDLIAEVRGRVVSISPSLVVGGFFAEGEELLRLDDREQRIAVDRALAQVRLRAAEAKLAQAEAGRRETLAERGVASEADLDQFRSRAAVAWASHQEARAALAQARLDLERSTVVAPFEGRVRERSVDIGQFVVPGAKLGRLQATDYAEVRLPIQSDDLAYLDLALALDAGVEAGGEKLGAEVVLKADLGGRQLEWPARLVRSEGEIDMQTRSLYVVARVDDPYQRREGSLLPAQLPSGLFVDAQIEGRALTEVFVLPLMALRDGSQVFVADAEGNLRVHDVEVLREDRQEVVIGKGLSAGDRVVVSPLRVYSEGMALRTVEADAS